MTKQLTAAQQEAREDLAAYAGDDAGVRRALQGVIDRVDAKAGFDPKAAADAVARAADRRKLLDASPAENAKAVGDFLRDAQEDEWSRQRELETVDRLKKGEGYVPESQADASLRLYGRRNPYGSTFIDEQVDMSEPSLPARRLPEPLPRPTPRSQSEIAAEIRAAATADLDSQVQKTWADTTVRRARR